MYLNPNSKLSIKMFKGIRDYLIILLLLSILLFAGFSKLTTWKARVEKTFILTVKVTYENRDPYEKWILTENDMTLGLFTNNSWQTVYLVRVSHPIKKLIYDSDGNPLALLNITDTALGLNEKMSYNATYRLVFKQRSIPVIGEDKSGTLEDIPENLRKEYCKPTGLWLSNATIFRKKALDIANNETKVLTIIKKFVRWIASNIVYSPSEVPKYPNETIFSHRGDCDDQANLLITLCRAIGIPAYLQIGCIYIPQYNVNRTYWSGHLIFKQERVGWHGWAMVYIPPWGWLPVDLTYVKGDLRKEPLNSIKFSAFASEYTFQYMNITKTDYVAETREFKEFLEKYKFYIYEEDEMKEVIIGEFPLEPILVVTIIVYLAISFNRLTLASFTIMRIVYMVKCSFQNFVS